MRHRGGAARQDPAVHQPQAPREKAEGRADQPPVGLGIGLLAVGVTAVLIRFAVFGAF